MRPGFYVDGLDNLMIFDGKGFWAWSYIVNDFHYWNGYPPGSWHLIEAFARK